jgi:hypothetical protein
MAAGYTDLRQKLQFKQKSFRTQRKEKKLVKFFPFFKSKCMKLVVGNGCDPFNSTFILKYMDEGRCFLSSHLSNVRWEVIVRLGKRGIANCEIHTAPHCYCNAAFAYDLNIFRVSSCVLASS